MYLLLLSFIFVFHSIFNCLLLHTLANKNFVRRTEIFVAFILFTQQVHVVKQMCTIIVSLSGD